ncbi:MAG: GIY-YIG catalytic domain protein [Candidatus Gottesmanbacteria bacterium GW2011_GWA1_43_11]|uniref:GIY-YIG catalytic domain protein n=1 Tax=Candidatus Gottesmanbacteria bacterium GW2011_GWA1_43_11 TaxID=1618436 RepID=A0A0G1CEA9_9BACT|nr:MAG: GIY-YIG catalytic domain protein [Candidatus Gottesmanbacteria bacterium GW2011_GWA1_43_11]
MNKQYYVYILASKKYGTLYIGVTNDLIRRIYEHKHHLVKGFTQKYDVTLLVYYEVFYSIEEALVREKQMKTWKRDWKINRIEGVNPEWNDLYSKLV